MRENIKNNYPKSVKLSDVGSHSGSSCLKLSSSSALLIATYFSEPLGGTPLDRSWPPLRNPGRIFLTGWKMLGASLLQISKNPEQQMAPDTPSKSKQGLRTTLPIINPNKS